MAGDHFEEFNDSDEEVFREPTMIASPAKAKLNATSSSQVVSPMAEDTFVPVGREILSLVKLLPAPTNPNAGASLNIRREMKSMVKQQTEEGPSKAGFYLDPVRSSHSPLMLRTRLTY